MRVRMCGDRVFTMDGKPFRKTDLSPREELSEARNELAGLEEWRREALRNLQGWPANGHPNMRRIEELKKKVYELDYIFNDSAPKTGVQTIADLNRLHAERYAKG